MPRCGVRAIDKLSLGLVHRVTKDLDSHIKGAVVRDPLLAVIIGKDGIPDLRMIARVVEATADIGAL